MIRSKIVAENEDGKISSAWIKFWGGVVVALIGLIGILIVAFQDELRSSTTPDNSPESVQDDTGNGDTGKADTGKTDTGEGFVFGQGILGETVLREKSDE